MKASRKTIPWRLCLTCLIFLLVSPFHACAGDSEATAVLETLRTHARPFRSASDLDPLLARAEGVRLVLLGEASHGTSEFYTVRDQISRRLVEEQGFRFLAVEGDWATIHLLNKYVKDLPGAPDSARTAMLGFDRWPVWMWANEETLALVEWLREHNRARKPEDRVGLYGMDLYGPGRALERLQALLAEHDEALAARVNPLYEGLGPLIQEPRRYVAHLARGGDSYAQRTEEALRLIKAGTAEWPAKKRAPRLYARIAARVVHNAEGHYRAMNRPGAEGWNIRARHFHQVVERLLAYYGEDAGGIVWAHNTHIGDARATGMARGGQVNIGQVAREAHGADAVVAVGFGTYEGTVVAGRRWGAEQQILRLPPGAEGSYEDLMNRIGEERLLFLFPRVKKIPPSLLAPRGHRAVGVVYNPEREVPGNYVPTLLPQRYDAFVFIRSTNALRPIGLPERS